MLASLCVVLTRIMLEDGNKYRYIQFIWVIAYYFIVRSIFPTNIFMTTAEKIRYISTEHPEVTYINPRYLEYANLTSQRYGRRNPFYYVGLHYKSLATVNHNVTIDFYFYEYLTNVYKRGFIEMHFDMCNLVQHDKFFGAPMKQGKLAKPCPWPPDEYHLYNMSIDVRVIPPGFPFTKGRIYANLTSKDYKDAILTAHIDMEIKEVNVKTSGKSKSLYRRIGKNSSVY